MVHLANAVGKCKNVWLKKGKYNKKEFPEMLIIICQMKQL